MVYKYRTREISSTTYLQSRASVLNICFESSGEACGLGDLLPMVLLLPFSVASISPFGMHD